MSNFHPFLNHLSSLKTDDSLYGNSDLVCFSHLCWDLIDQHPKDLLTQYAKQRRVFFIEEPVIEFTDSWHLDVSERADGIWVVVPHLLDWVIDELRVAMHQSLMNELFEQYAIANPILWRYTPAALSSSGLMAK